MSTRSAIGKLNENGTVDGVYCHFDGYPDGVGQTLMDWIAGQPMERRNFVIDKLLAERVGWSQLAGTDIDLPPSWDERRWDAPKPEREAPQSYTARGETDEWAHEFADVEAFVRHFGVSYVYLFSADMTSMTVYYGYPTKQPVKTVALDVPVTLEVAEDEA